MAFFPNAFTVRFGSRSGGADAPSPLLTMVFDTALGLTVGVPLQMTGETVIDWGDGATTTTSTSGWHTHTYSTAEEFTVTVDGPITRLWHSVNPTTQYIPLKRVLSWGNRALTHVWLRHAVNLIEVPNWLPTTLNNLNETFKECWLINDPNISLWNTSNITNFTETFKEAKRFNQPLPWNTASATNMQRMFGSTEDFNQSLASFSVTLVTDMADMFNGALKFDGHLFANETVSLTSIQNFLLNAAKFKKPLTNLKTTLCSNFSSLMNGAAEWNGDVTPIDTSNATNMAGAFGNMPAWTGTGFSSLDFSKVTNASSLCLNNTLFNGSTVGMNFAVLTNGSGMFQSCPAFTGAGISTHAFPALTNAASMFAFCQAFNSTLAAFTGAPLTTANAMLRQCPSFNASIAHINLDNVPNLAQFLNGSSSMASALPTQYHAATSMISMISNTGLSGANLSNWCVPLVPSKPTGFDTGITLAALPVWGTCP